MRRKVITLVAVIAVIASTIGIGYAYTSTLNSGGNELDVDHISVVNSNGGSFIEVPSVVFASTGSTYKPDQEAKTADGTLTLTSSAATVEVRAWVEFQSALTWTAIKTLTLTVTVDGTDHEYEIFNASADTGSLRTCLPTDVITLAPGSYGFNFTVVYKTSMDVNPTAYTGDNMKSRIVFLMNGTDPLQAPSPSP